MHHPLVKQIPDAARCILARPTERKTPLKADLVKKLLERLEQGNLSQITACYLYRSGILRFPPLG